MIQRALDLAVPLVHRELLIEIQLYRYANDPEHRLEALQKMKLLIGGGVRSPHWSFSTNIARAEKDGHPNVPLLKALIAVIAGGADPATLDAFEEWQDVS